MKLVPYESFDEWKKDMNKVSKHPNDRKLIQHVSNRVEISSVNIKQMVKDYLMDSAMEKNPWAVIDQASRDNPHCMVMVRSKDDPFFHV